MHKPCSLILLAAVLSTSLFAQQTPAAGQTAPSTTTPKSSAPKTAHKPVAKTAAPKPLTTSKDKFSYALGMNLGGGLHRQSVDIDPDVFMRGFKDALAGRKTQLTDDEARAAITNLQAELRAATKKRNQDFLEENKVKQGVVALPSGLQYKILQEGTGPKPAATDTVVCNYRGTLIDGKEFDSSAKHGGPATFPVSGVIKGWTEALQLMPVGSKWQLFIPSDLAYADRGAGQDIGPGATLIFEVELVSIQKPEEKKPDAPAEPEKK
ncbi:MAG TPA: FKBP-type peptidyl-prolyl cis-trans isomerase [Candidatus Sulfotelmatobacter sp.]|nr:FKBP-type peptidyl-prolyl cis-trans isomerase [Candidatus Sulfotelmatobacter sp.]